MIELIYATTGISLVFVICRMVRSMRRQETLVDIDFITLRDCFKKRGK